MLKTWSSTAPMLAAMGPVILIIFGIGSQMSTGSLGSQVVSTAFIVAGTLWLLIMTRLLDPNRPAARQVLPGEVVQAETRRVKEGRYRSEKINVLYQFTGNDGMLTRGTAEAYVEETSDFRPLAPGTPVYVWVEPGGKHHLL